MRAGRFVGSVMIALAAAWGTGAAQEPQCTGTTQQARDACNAAVDAVNVAHPLFGILVSGGNPLLGSGAGLGGLGHFSASARVNAVRIHLPDPDSAGQTSVPSSFAGFVPAPVLEGAVGVFPGLATGLLSVDALGSAVLLPTNQIANLEVDRGAARVGAVALGLGYGVRVGVLRGALLVPSVSISVMRRHLPRLQYGDVGAGDPMDFAADLDATNIRAVAGWRLVTLDVAAGVGIDSYSSRARIRYRDLTVQTVSLDLDNGRELVFVNAGLTLALVKLVAELGYQTGKDQALATDFSDFDPSAGHVFWSTGVRVTF